MHTADTVTMNGDLDRIVELAADVERWPEILPHYRWVTLLEGGGDYKVVEMAARRERIPVKWRAIQKIDRSGPIPIINYRHIWGVTKGMDVDWTFVQEGERIHVTITHDFAPPWPLIGPVVTERVIGPHFVDYIAGQTLATIKAIVERERDAAT